MMKNLINAIVLMFVVHQTFAHQPPGVPLRNQHQPPAGGHGHGQPGHGHGHGKPLEFASEVHNADHILEHLQRVVATKSKDEMTEEELEFHYFKLHDYDNNNKLDGVEIGKALTHFHDETPAEAGKEEHVKIFSDDEIANIVDSVFTENDANKDGYIEYFEFKKKQAEQKVKEAPVPDANGQQNTQQQAQQP